MDAQEMKAALEDKHEMLIKAAEFGKTLLEANQELEKQVEEMTTAHSEKVEALEQEKHLLQLKYTCLNSNFECVKQELDSLSSQLDTEHTIKVKRLKELHLKKNHELNTINEGYKAEVEKLEIKLKTCREKIRLQEESIEELKGDISYQSTPSVLQHELKDLEQLYKDEHSKCEVLQMQLMETEGNLEVVSVERERLQHKVATLEDECEERCRLSNEWFESLKEVKERNSALKIELDFLKELAEGPHGAKGNSLFGEVEDRRFEAEQRLLSLKVKFETLEKTHSVTKQRYSRLKAEMSALFCRYSATTADSEHVQRLERALSQSKSENEGLHSKVYRLERQLADRVDVHNNRKMMSAFVDFGDKVGYIQFLEQEIDRNKGDQEKVLKELDMKRTQLVWESNKLSEAESKLYHSDQQNARKKEELTRLRIRLQESMEKLTQVGARVTQIEAEKSFLERELKSRGHHKPLAPVNKTQTEMKFSFSSSKSSHPTTTTRSSDNVYSNSNDDSSNKNEPDKSDTTHPQQQQPHVVMNLLEELDLEFGKQKGSGRGYTLGTGIEGGRVQTIDTGSVDENTRPTVGVQPTVIRVSKQEKVNECSQQ